MILERPNDGSCARKEMSVEAFEFIIGREEHESAWHADSDAHHPTIKLHCETLHLHSTHLPTSGRKLAARRAARVNSFDYIKGSAFGSRRTLRGAALGVARKRAAEGLKSCGAAARVELRRPKF
jgi:hypothetical protein